MQALSQLSYGPTEGRELWGTDAAKSNLSGLRLLSQDQPLAPIRLIPQTRPQGRDRTQASKQAKLASDRHS